MRSLAHALVISGNVAFAYIGLKMGPPALIGGVPARGRRRGEMRDGRIVHPPS